MTGRDDKGRFLPGNSGGGRKRREDEDTIKAALDAAMPMPDVVALFAKCVKQRDPWAITLWLAYHWGKPIERVEASGPDGGPIQITEVVVERERPEESASAE